MFSYLNDDEAVMITNVNFGACMLIKVNNLRSAALQHVSVFQDFQRANLIIQDCNTID